MKKLLLLILTLILGVNAFCQNTPENNLGFNILLEGEGMGNSHYGMGGVSIVFGSQLSPNFFVGVGLKNLWGGLNDDYRVRQNRQRRIGSEDNVYWVDQKNDRYRFHGWDQYGNELFFNAKYDINNWEDRVVKDETGHVLNLHEAKYDGYDDDCDDWKLFGFFYWKFVPQMCVKVDLLPRKTVCPYVDARFGINLFRSSENSKYCTDASLMLGTRIAFGESDHAFLFSAGWNRSDMRGYDSYLKWEDAFVMKIGVEF